MKVDQSLLGSFGSVVRAIQARNDSEIDGADEKKLGSEAKIEPESNSANALPRPIVLEGLEVHLRFNKDKETGIQVIQVVDAHSGKLLRQIPAPELLAIAKALRETKGLFVSRES